MVLSGISDMYIVDDGTGSTDVHIITWHFSTGALYKGYFDAFYDDGDIVGVIGYTDRSEYFTISKNQDGTVTVSVQGVYEGGGTYEYATTMEWVESVTELGKEYYIENYGGVWLNFVQSQMISSISLSIVDANTLQANVYTRCGDDVCEWYAATADMYPGIVEFTFTNAAGDTLDVELTMDASGSVSAVWEIAYSGGGVATGTQSFIKLIPL